MLAGGADRVQRARLDRRADLGGVLVGIGVHFGNGCPSGHGICGMARLSPRSLVAVPTFMATAFVTVFVIRHVIGA